MVALPCGLLVTGAGQVSLIGLVRGRDGGQQQTRAGPQTRRTAPGPLHHPALLQPRQDPSRRKRRAAEHPGQRHGRAADPGVDTAAAQPDPATGAGVQDHQQHGQPVHGRAVPGAVREETGRRDAAVQVEEPRTGDSLDQAVQDGQLPLLQHQRIPLPRLRAAPGRAARGGERARHRRQRAHQGLGGVGRARD